MMVNFGSHGAHILEEKIDNEETNTKGGLFHIAGSI